MASAVALANGKGGETGNEGAALGIAGLVVATQRRGDRGACKPA